MIILMLKSQNELQFIFVENYYNSCKIAKNVAYGKNHAIHYFPLSLLIYRKHQSDIFLFFVT